ncbi:hypothetical protein AUC43_04510 [Hymenobacter sedentarius]|uniref:Uncharacterized protein n=1 Tax=Hymenobacter sedentarius TaxID=1411621 RepID=A0A0U3JUR8_9BACT|nr:MULTISPECIES: hypothetical protein [Hymenobacter]ALW84415.1 hypothetical protein AUC43_04510 [Hymenobacter sedentarius]MCC3153422.1 hypothetical protein [Hymenobacter sp. BT770]MDO3415496.1 hypothetical protein [Hymenobacter sp. BT770]
MTFDKSLLRTVLFAVGVVALVIGIYQTILFNDLAANYWIFMVSMLCWMPLLYWRQQERVAAKVAEEEARLAKQARAKTPAKSTKKRR